jgi:hypothetical protein
MTIGKTGAIVLGVLTAVPFAWIGVAFLGFVLLFLTAFRGAASHTHAPAPPGWFFILFVGELAIILLIFGLLVFYVIHLFRTTLVPSDKKALWAVVLLLGNLFAMPVYWFLYIWRPLRAQGPPAEALNGSA